MNARSHLLQTLTISSVIFGFIRRHMVCHTASMLRRHLLGSLPSFALMSLGALCSAHATSAILPSATALPLEQRVAVAVSSKQTTLWTNLRLDTAATPVALIIPVPPGAALDHGSDAWFEALDDATAPRVFPPTGTAYVCPGAAPDPASTGFHDTTRAEPLAGIEPTETAILQDVPAVLNWANTHGFTISPATKAALEASPGMRFFAERFVPNTAPFFSSTLRVVLPSSNPVLPLTLTQAGSSNVRVTTWFVGAGRATLTGSSPLKLQMSDLQWFAQSQTSSYVEMRDAALFAAGTSATVTETSSHAALVKNSPLPDGKGSITSVITGYFQRASTYMDVGAGSNSATCIFDASVAAESAQTVAHACPRANLGVVDGSPSCTEAPNGAEVDPAKLRCGGRSDDVALALSDLQPANTWITRMTMILPKDMSGQTWPITFASVAPEVDPVETAASISFAGCDGMGSSSSSGNGSSSGNPTTGASTSGGPVTTGNGSGGNSTYVPSDDSDMSCGCGGPAGAPVIIDQNYGGAGGAGGSGGGYGGDVYYDDTTSDDCSGSTVDSTDPAYADTSSSDDCDGSTVESTDPAYSDTSSSDDCDGSTSDSTYSDTSSSSDEGIDCSGDSTGGGGSSGGSTDYTDSSDSSDSSDCTVARANSARAKPHKRGPKASVMTLGLLAILAPLRRLTRPRRKGRDQRDKLASKQVS